MQIREMTIADYPPVFELWCKTPGMGLNRVDDSPEGIARYLKRNPDCSFVAETDGAITGVILAGHDGRRGHLYHLAVAAGRQRRGIGRALVEAALAALARDRISKVSLVAFADNRPGRAFWETLGFTVRDDLVYRNRTLIASESINTAQAKSEETA